MSQHFWQDGLSSGETVQLYCNRDLYGPVVNTMGISVLKAVAPPAQILSIVFKTKNQKTRRAGSPTLTDQC